MTTSVFIDSGAWNVLFEQGINLLIELPPEEFSLYITLEVYYELQAIPNMGKDGTSKVGLKHYIREALERSQIGTTATFGFYVRGAERQPYAPFNQGTFQSETDREWYLRKETQDTLRNKATRPSGLGAHVADASLAVRAQDSIILTTDTHGLLARAAEQGGKVVSLAGFNGKTISLRDFIMQSLEHS
jgi:hypothetical protein